jgi:hypothetical protein
MKIVDKIDTQFVDSQSVFFGFDLSSRRQELDLAKLGVQELQISHPENRTSNVYGEWMSPKDSHLLNKNLQPICQLVLNICGQIWSDVFENGQRDSSHDFYMWQCWAINYGNGGHAKSHNHFPAFFAAVLYLEADDVSAPIVFGINSVRPALQNALYIFPGALQHEVPVNHGKRIVLAMNILKRNPIEPPVI